MKQNAIREFKLWVVCMTAGVSVLATEVVVKARRPVEPLVVPSATEPIERRADAAPMTSKPLPESVVADLLVDAVIQIESGGKPRQVGSKGERGLMQIMPGTWRETTRNLFGKTVSFERAFEPEMNRRVGTAYLAQLHQFLQEHREAWQADERALLLASYNAGPKRVAAANFNLRRLPASTRDYVERAAALHDLYLKEHALRLEPGDQAGSMQIVQVLPDPNS
ncbi:MAG TPA: lytic transglycosylase domain-containing protein [Kiritimatiellia bacterium]|nr:lytic transglycosylase domain-containing protein [Kiritimatiellia bacterium]HMP00331.1 lytic transglycosylase domain-containing protein [Kiritimatiellia bacterium]HMP97556.1 lytic transglycosylase domain-containing protein [Kiritimatiellia bacterium]